MSNYKYNTCITIIITLGCLTGEHKACRSCFLCQFCLNSCEFFRILGWITFLQCFIVFGLFSHLREWLATRPESTSKQPGHRSPSSSRAPQKGVASVSEQPRSAVTTSGTLTVAMLCMTSWRMWV